MLCRIPVTLRCGCVKKPGAISGRNLKSVFRSDRTHAQGFDGKPKIFGRTGRGSQVEDVVHRPRVKRLADVPFLEGEARFVGQVSQVVPVARGEVVDADYSVAFAQQPICQMGTKETGGAGNQYAHAQ